MTMYSHIGTHKSELVELEIKGGNGLLCINVMLGGKTIGDVYGAELQQIIQYLVNNGAVDAEELLSRKQIAEGTRV